MSAMKELLGETVIKGKDAESVPVDSFTGPGKVVGLYFSAHWCGPCRVFTPALATFYTDVKAQENKPFEIVFLSSDRDEKSFKEYYDEMPWLAIPHGDSRKQKLSQKYKIRGIPTLILLDGETGELISKDGRSIVTQDPKANDYPWPRPTFNSALQGAKLINNKKEEIDVHQALDGKVKGLYFSAHWCPPCRGFTPSLVDTYNKINKDEKKFEIIFLSADRDDASFQEYFDTMPWLSLPLGCEAQKKLEMMFEVSGIPTLVVLDENNKVITESGRRAVDQDPDGKDFPWHAKALNKLSGAAFEALNEGICVLLINEDKSKEQEMVDAMTSTAEKYVNKEDAPLFFYGFTDDEDGEGFLDSLFDYLGISEPKYPMLLTVNLPGGWRNVQQEVSLSKDVVEETLSKHENGTLDNEPLSG